MTCDQLPLGALALFMFSVIFIIFAVICVCNARSEPRNKLKRIFATGQKVVVYTWGKRYPGLVLGEARDGFYHVRTKRCVIIASPDECQTLAEDAAKVK